MICCGGVGSCNGAVRRESETHYRYGHKYLTMLRLNRVVR